MEVSTEPIKISKVTAGMMTRMKCEENMLKCTILVFETGSDDLFEQEEKK